MRKFFFLAASFIFLSPLLLAAGSLSLEDRINAQAAIERVYYNHRIWPKENPNPKPPFEQVVSRNALQTRVNLYLKESALLDQFWQRPISSSQLQQEINRFTLETKAP